MQKLLTAWTTHVKIQNGKRLLIQHSHYYWSDFIFIWREVSTSHLSCSQEAIEMPALYRNHLGRSSSCRHLAAFSQVECAVVGRLTQSLMPHVGESRAWWSFDKQHSGPFRRSLSPSLTARSAVVLWEQMCIHPVQPQRTTRGTLIFL